MFDPGPFSIIEKTPVPIEYIHVINCHILILKEAHIHEMYKK